MKRALLASCLLATSGVALAAEGPRLTIVAVDPQPKSHRASDTDALASLRAAVAAAPKLRKPRLDLVHSLVRAGLLPEAHAAALEWRKHDAYNLVAVRQLGDIEAALGDQATARRTYSAIVELLPKDIEARRALATLFKQAGDLDGARRQLQAARVLAPDDRRTAFELGDVEQRLGHEAEAMRLFQETIDAPDTNEAVAYPARQRMSQLYAAARHRALAAKNPARAAELSQLIENLGVHGGIENDIKVYLSWDTDRTDVDLWVITPKGEKVFYAHKLGRDGESLFDDVTTGYGPETFTAEHAQPGDYKIVVDFYGAREAGKEARGEIIVVVNEGRTDEQRRVFPYRLFDQKDSVTLARVHVGGGR
jgi:tetratricopeptide (TPR) repeat protein